MSQKIFPFESHPPMSISEEKKDLLKNDTSKTQNDWIMELALWGIT